MDVVDLLTQKGDVIVERAVEALERSHLRHYADAGPEESKERLAELLALVQQSIRQRDLVPMVQHATKVAKDRFTAGYDIHEVQTAFNVLEEAIWTQVVEATPPDELAHAIGMVATVLGAGKDALAREYVSLATHQHVRSLDLSALFRGSTTV